MVRNKRRNGQRRRHPNRQPDWLMRILGGAFILALAITAYLAFVTIRDITKSVTAFDLPGVAISSNGEPEIAGVPESELPSGEISPATDDTDLAPWDGASRVTILVMGLDLRDWEADQGAPRTDTMILLTLDPITKTAGMLSIPRDLWVEIPGFEHAKINTAYQIGEGSQLPGGGPGLAVRTVEEFMGITINYYAQVDFDAFVRFIDEIGGVKVDIPAEIKVDIIGRPNPIKLQPGVQNLYGEYALAYARARNSENGDFDRAQRQQQVIIAMRNQLLRPDTQAHVLTNAVSIFNDLQTGIRTNMTFDEAIKLGLLATQIDLANISRGVISPPKQVTLDMSPDGTQSILKPVTQEIRILRDEIFSASVVTAPVILNAQPADLVELEAATIGIYNGTATGGLAGTTEQFLIGQGINVIEVGNADITTSTTIIDYTGKPYTVDFLMNLMGIQKTRYFNKYDPNSAVDIEIIIGGDWAVP